MQSSIGITPADAGKTKKLQFAADGMEDHPRGCGENLPSAVISDAAKGSPPRMRGKRTSAAAPGLFSGITPADAGKTYTTSLTLNFEKDHPRGCGENKLRN